MSLITRNCYNVFNHSQDFCTVFKNWLDPSFLSKNFVGRNSKWKWADKIETIYWLLGAKEIWKGSVLVVWKCGCSATIQCCSLTRAEPEWRRWRYCCWTHSCTWNYTKQAKGYLYLFCLFICIINILLSVVIVFKPFTNFLMVLFSCLWRILLSA